MSKSHGDIETPDPVPVTSEYITRLFLYGDPITPEHIPDRLRDDSQSGATGEVDAQQYMNTYAQYAVPARAGLVQKFFEGQISLLPGTYTSEYLASVVGGAEAQFSYVNAYVDIGGNNYMERAYIFGHAAFYISPDSLFVVEAGGTRRMENVRVVPEEDNFDFVSTGISQILNDNVLQPRIVPFEIGKTVTIQFS